ncbi:MAG: dTMP kinase [Synechococcaceae cyanobacterium]|nr:dTMP kinase [Synechococcaceae cyanobacterium]
MASEGADAAWNHRSGEPGCRVPGRFVVLEGIDGSGKTTQLERLRQWLPGSGLMPASAALVVTREPGGTALGRALRQLLLHPPEQASPCSTSELLLYAADRAQHVQTLIRPALERGDWVLSDRFSGSTLAYQGDGRGLSRELIGQLELWATAGLTPDLTLWLDLPVAAAGQRRSDRGPDRIEAAGEAFQERVAAGFARLAAERAWCRIPADQPLEQVAAAVRAALCSRLQPAAGVADG